MTTSFQTTYPELAAAVGARARWRMLDDAGLAVMKHALRGARASELWVFASQADIRSMPANLSGIKHILSEKAARDKIFKADVARSRFNVCNK